MPAPPHDAARMPPGKAASRRSDANATSPHERRGEREPQQQRSIRGTRVTDPGAYSRSRARMRTRGIRAVATSVLSLGCVALAVTTAGPASASSAAPAPAPVLHWSPPRPAGAGDIRQVSCPSKTFCAAIDTDGHALTFNGKTWSAPVTVDPYAGGLGS